VSSIWSTVDEPEQTRRYGYNVRDAPRTGIDEFRFIDRNSTPSHQLRSLYTSAGRVPRKSCTPTMPGHFLSETSGYLNHDGRRTNYSPIGPLTPTDPATGLPASVIASSPTTRARSVKRKVTETIDANAHIHSATYADVRSSTSTDWTLASNKPLGPKTFVTTTIPNGERQLRPSEISRSAFSPLAPNDALSSGDIRRERLIARRPGTGRPPNDAVISKRNSDLSGYQGPQRAWIAAPPASSPPTDDKFIVQTPSQSSRRPAKFWRGKLNLMTAARIHSTQRTF